METPECPIKSLSLDEAIAHADEVAGDCGTACKREHKQLADWLRELKSRRSAERGDCAKLREALNRLVIASEGFLKTHSAKYYVDTTEALDKAKAAVATPPRNCDVGTAEEQADRMDAVYCSKRLCAKGKCPLFKPGGDCSLIWAQMPYEEGGTK